MKNNFYNKSVKKIFTEKNIILDIGGGLRLSKEKSNRFSKDNIWLEPFLKKVEY